MINILANDGISQSGKDALEKAGKEHELIIVPKEGHGFRKPENRSMLYTKMLEHFDSTL